MKKEPFKPNCYYHIKNVANNFEDFFYEHDNYLHFVRLIQKHLGAIGEIQGYCLFRDSFEVLLKIKPEQDIPHKFRAKMHLPFSNCFNAYTKAFNKKYERTGSLFREHFYRKHIPADDVIAAFDHLRRVSKTGSRNRNPYLFIV